MTKTEIIIVLGNRLKTKGIHSELKGRMDTAINLYHESLVSRNRLDLFLILSGGKANPNVGLSESEIMRIYAKDKQIPEGKILVEDQSLDTIGNAFFTMNIVNGLKDVTRIYVVSSCYHMNRVKYIFSMCYGNRYDLNFNICYPHEMADSADKEAISLGLATNFFGDITAGDIKAIGIKLRTQHDLYKN
jgi:uncharacterized SAM-binding protein YcdF (DUF218 family)